MFLLFSYFQPNDVQITLILDLHEPFLCTDFWAKPFWKELIQLWFASLPSGQNRKKTV